jgi:competence ComEA-like helix-hairpin-helix protein
MCKGIESSVFAKRNLRIAVLRIAGALFLFASPYAIAQKKQPPAHPVDLNSASIEQLQRVPGIGPKTAQAIVNFRQKSGPFQRLEDLLAIKGITRAKLEQMRRYVTISPPKTQ